MTSYAGPELLQNAATATGNGGILSVQGYNAALVKLSGTFDATVTFEANLDTVNDDWVAVDAYNVGTGAHGTTATATGLYFVPLAGAEEFRARVSAYVSGNVTARARKVETAQPFAMPFAASVALADGAANPTTAMVGAAELLWNGLTWDRKKSYAESRTVSASDTAQTVTITLDNLKDTLSIVSVASAATATLKVEGSVNNTNFVTIDDIATAASHAKVYGPTTAGATTAVSPLSFQYVKITAGAALAGTTTLTISAK